MAEPTGSKGKDDHLKYLRVIAEVTGIPFVLLGGPIVGFLIGSFLDRKLNSGRLFLIIFIALGFAAAVKETVQVIKRVQKGI